MSMFSQQIRLVISGSATLVVVIAGSMLVLWMARQPGAEVTRPAVGAITANVAAITDVVQSPAYTRLVALAPAVKPTAMGNSNPFPGPKEEERR